MRTVATPPLAISLSTDSLIIQCSIPLRLLLSKRYKHWEGQTYHFPFPIVCWLTVDVTECCFKSGRKTAASLHHLRCQGCGLQKLGYAEMLLSAKLTAEAVVDADQHIARNPSNNANVV